ncbi:MAG: hypothetical protein J5651_00260 [Salinivirgaceae bacterium]|nr:hypothetical protein [Salinivirgaceae bacterium]
MGKGIVITEAGQGAPFRKLPSKDGEMIGVFEPNTELELQSYDNGWYAVNYEGDEGFINGKFVQALDGIEGLDGKKVKAAKAVAKAVKKVTGKKTSTKKAAPAKTVVVKSIVSPVKEVVAAPQSAAAVKDAVNAAQKVAKISTTPKAVVQAKPQELKMTGYPKAIADKAKSAVKVAKVEPTKKLTKAEAAKVYEANKIVSVERTPKGLSITLEGTDGFDGFDGIDEPEVMDGLYGKLKSAILKAAKNAAATKGAAGNPIKVTSKGVYEANKVINIQRTDNGFRITLQGINGFDGIDGLDDEETLNGLLKNIASKAKDIAKKVIGGARTVTETADAVNEVKAAVNNTTSQPAASQQTQANSNLNIQNQSTMDANATSPAVTTETGDKKKKFLLWGGIGLGAVVLGVVGYKLFKRKPAADAAAGKLSGVGRKKRRKSAVKKIELF